MFPIIGHAHPSFFRNADVTARLDVRPWPVAARWIAGATRTGRWSANTARYTKDWNPSPYSGLLRENVNQLANIDFERIEARICAWAELHGGEISL